jgi:hypothetical protein
MVDLSFRIDGVKRYDRAILTAAVDFQTGTTTRNRAPQRIEATPNSSPGANKIRSRGFGWPKAESARACGAVHGRVRPVGTGGARCRRGREASFSFAGQVDWADPSRAKWGQIQSLTGRGAEARLSDAQVDMLAQRVASMLSDRFEAQSLVDRQIAEHDDAAVVPDHDFKPIAWVQLGSDGDWIVRAIFADPRNCPRIKVEANSYQMRERRTFAEGFYPVLVCEFLVHAGEQVSVEGVGNLPIRHATLTRFCWLGTRAAGSLTTLGKVVPIPRSGRFEHYLRMHGPNSSGLPKDLNRALSSSFTWAIIIIVRGRAPTIGHVAR